MSLTCHEEIGRVGRRCYEDASDLSATSRACRARGIWRTTRHMDKRTALYTAADRRSANQVSAWQAERVEVGRHARHARHHRSILARMLCVSGVSASMSRGFHEDATRKLLPWNLSYTPRCRTASACLIIIIIIFV